MYVSVSSTCLHCVCFDFFCNTAEALSIEIISWYITCVLLFTRYLGCEQEETPQGQGQWLKFFRSFQATRPLNSEAGSAECECSGVSCSERVFYLWVKEIDWTIQHSATSAAGSNGVYCWPFFDRNLPPAFLHMGGGATQYQNQQAYPAGHLRSEAAGGRFREGMMGRWCEKRVTRVLCFGELFRWNTVIRIPPLSPSRNDEDWLICMNLVCITRLTPRPRLQWCKWDPCALTCRILLSFLQWWRVQKIWLAYEDEPFSWHLTPWHFKVWMGSDSICNKLSKQGGCVMFRSSLLRGW